MSAAEFARRWPWAVPLLGQAKALVAALVAAAASSITAALSDGVVTSAEARAIAGAAVSGYLLTFAVRNRGTSPEPSPAEPAGAPSS